MSVASIERLGEDALLLRFGDTIDTTCNARVHRLAARIEGQRPIWLRDLVPAYASLALFVDGDVFADDADPLTEAGRWLQALADEDDPRTIDGDRPMDDGHADSSTVEIVVRYGGEDGPDLVAVAEHADLSPEEVIARHVASDYTVAMLGFAPGFPYLIGLDPRLATPRLDTPRTRAPTGSVGIGDAQTGIYPRGGPGGWRLIGRTTKVLFDPVRDPPTALAPGDHVRFIRADACPPDGRR